MKDEAGPLWLFIENVYDWLGFWGRLSIFMSFLIAFLLIAALTARKKS